MPTKVKDRKRNHLLAGHYGKQASVYEFLFQNRKHVMHRTYTNKRDTTIKKIKIYITIVCQYLKAG